MKTAFLVIALLLTIASSAYSQNVEGSIAGDYSPVAEVEGNLTLVTLYAGDQTSQEVKVVKTEVTGYYIFSENVSKIKIFKGGKCQRTITLDENNAAHINWEKFDFQCLDQNGNSVTTIKTFHK